MSMGFGLGSSIIKGIASHQLDLHHRVTDGNQFAYRCDCPVTKPFDHRFWRRLHLWESTQAFHRLNQRRLEVVSGIEGGMLEVGVGAGGFFRENLDRDLWGYDVLDKSVSRVIRGRYCPPGEWAKIRSKIAIVCCFDVLDLVAEPDQILETVPCGGRFVASIPMFPDLTMLKGSKVFQPTLRNLYFSESGFFWYIKQFGFEIELFESEAGLDPERENVRLVVCKKANA